MGPALRPTPLSPACGLPKERLTPGVSMPPGCSCEPRTAASPSPGARAGAGSDRGLGSIRRSLPPPGGSETDLSAWASNGPALPEGFAVPRRQTGKSGLSDFAPSRDQRFEIWKSSEDFFLVSSLLRAAFAVASKRFQNPFFLAGLSAFVSEGPIPVSMIGRCAVRPIRATADRPTYPLLLVLPVDKAG